MLKFAYCVSNNFVIVNRYTRNMFKTVAGLKPLNGFILGKTTLNMYADECVWTACFNIINEVLQKQ